MDVTDGFPSKDDDGLLYEEVRAWSEEKYHLVQHYTSLFCRSMSGKWQSLVYIDLFSGPGRSRIDNKRIIDAPPLLALNSEYSFDKYIFSDISKDKCSSLEKRISTLSNANITNILNGDVNLITDQILNLMPRYRSDYKVLGFCFVDPYRIENLKFETIRKLADRYIDFLVLIPTDIDANRNAITYEKITNTKLDEFLGRSDWRDDWHIAKLNNEHFGIFVANQFTKSMKQLRYIDPKIENMKLIRSDDKNLPLYRLALYSRHKLGGKFWKESVKYTNPQSDMFN